MDVKAQVTTALRGGLTRFKYRKGDGSIREATGTLHEDFLPKREAGAAPTRSPPDDVVVYWDHEAGGFRQFKLSSLVDLPTPFTPDPAT